MDDHEKELTYHTLFEIRPAGKTDKGILLIHGLGDSPWTYRDLATKLAEQGMLVRTVLLPGHGTKPADMIGVTSEDWNKAVQEQIDPVKERSSERLARRIFQPEVTLPSLRQPKIRTFEA